MLARAMVLVVVLGCNGLNMKVMVAVQLPGETAIVVFEHAYMPV